MILINEQILASTLRILSEDGEFVGVLARDKAINYARSQNKDLVCINENLPEPLCKVIDYGKFAYLEKKNKKKFKQPKIELKEVQIRPTTDLHDLQTKAKHVQEFLEHGHKVKIAMSLRGREMDNIQVAQSNFDKFLSLIDPYSIEKPKSITENTITIFIKGE